MDIFPLDNYSYSFPNPRLASNEGILAYGGDLSPTRLFKAYSMGIFPWYNKTDPILWWSPNPRLILNLDEFKVSKSLKKTINSNIFEIKFDENFKELMLECSKIKRENQKGSWIHDEVIESYNEFYKLGFAHSFESYYEGELVGGGYGVVIGDIFCGESMFAKKSDASKVALYYLIERLKKSNFRLIDCQIPTKHLKSLGAKEISRDSFLELIQKALENPREF
ncbi:leucyl/phenylalanyl-tRNA--protein transferase [Halarcobacter ebronensis]|uniref:Leucyl/phenylalanyl-tRNA--protein transferase n=1 Tax=Halarcobacter ebronensis TaxID=1462615 RepID=A0A4Q1AMH9_9BACT|nr:leucyl/phenylalanyl-tRNA--protein transferase [Halarcobacter ebronensis]QKF82878.1 leucyl, phenylalanyl-tRNA-protein transferase [Halarcobacter ebronensis]RXK06896.1 leucyl/phenylalanyl-tRNA--protein transferase [Halarcobacter ebronensis]